MKAKVIALYLPQYHPTEDNDKWWGKGFTEWTNVAKAKPLFKGHYQPRIPADLGFYDLRLPETRNQQAELAKRAGVSAFCYYHYWFHDGLEELQRPFNEVVESTEPNFPFCLCWANEDWYAKMWNNDGTASKRLLARQEYLGYADNEAHFYSLLKAFKDPRYLKYNGKLVFMIYQPLLFKNCQEFIKQWNELAVSNGLPGFHFIGQNRNPDSPEITERILSLGFNAVNVLRLDNFQYKSKHILTRGLNFISHRLLNRPYINNYAKCLKLFVGEEECRKEVYPSIIPNWDHTPRSGRGGYLFVNCEPKFFEQHCRMVINTLKDKDEEDQIVFLKSWNEWGEGNYMEPDQRYGCQYIDTLRKVLNED